MGPYLDRTKDQWWYRRSLVVIFVNGERKEVGPLSVLGLLENLEINPRRVAIELNLEILPKPDYATTALQDGDRVEIVHFVGGG